MSDSDGETIGKRQLAVISRMYRHRVMFWKRRPDHNLLSAASGSFVIGVALAQEYPEAAVAVRDAFFRKPHEKGDEDTLAWMIKYVATGRHDTEQP